MVGSGLGEGCWQVVLEPFIVITPDKRHHLLHLMGFSVGEVAVLPDGRLALACCSSSTRQSTASGDLTAEAPKASEALYCPSWRLDQSANCGRTQGSTCLTIGCHATVASFGSPGFLQDCFHSGHNAFTHVLFNVVSCQPETHRWVYQGFWKRLVKGAKSRLIRNGNWTIL